MQIWIPFSKGVRVSSPDPDPNIGSSKWRDEACALYRLRGETSANTTRISFPYGAMNFFAALAIRILIANSWTSHGVSRNL
jgi:hypothetical protein